MHFFSSLRRSLRAAALPLIAALPLAASAQDGKPIEWVLGYAAGGGSDVVARTLAEAMGKSLGRTIIVNNKPGAATNIAADYVAKSKDVGNVMLTADFATLAANPALFARLPYDAERDFAPVGLLVRFPMLLVVSPQVPARNYKEFVAWAQANAGGTNYASAGIGSPHHLAAELLRERSGLKLIHTPYRGAGPAVQDLMGGQVPFMIVDSASIISYLNAGKLRALAVASPARLKTLPDVPTFDEQGVKGFEAYAWQGLAVPAATPRDTVDRFNRALVSALDSTQVKARLFALALEPTPGTPAQMASYAKAERERWGRLIKDNGIKLD
ncbi:tripartite tricarboxylate transporter substrate binding protein [Aquincola sp. MAHUQ-54]|uniref:Tripartite tricarboxylate transporter substrate binding protein n=1 Tax=Aquincola agrisoli TaxID=3119538 RepID=A0AAW9QBX3_9BURK